MSASQRLGDQIRAETIAAHRAARQRSLRTAQAIARGEISIPLRCGECRAPSVVLDAEDDRFLRCLQCSRPTRLSTAHQLRQHGNPNDHCRGRRPAAQSKGKLVPPTKRKRRITPELIARMTEMRQQGATLEQTADACGVTTQTVGKYTPKGINHHRHTVTNHANARAASSVPEPTGRIISSSLARTFR